MGVLMPRTHHQNERGMIALVRSCELEIDDEGRVWRVKMRHGLKRGGSATITVERRRADKRIGDYMMVYATLQDGKVHGAMAHRLVWQHFFGNIPDGLTINHKNGIKTDNRPVNLEVVTQGENEKHAYRTGLKSQWGERNPVAKMAAEQVSGARARYAAGGISQGQLACCYGVSFQTMSRTLRGENRRTDDGPTSAADHRSCDGSTRDAETGRFLPVQHLGLPWEVKP